MAERIDDRLLFQILKGLQARAMVLEAMLGEIRDGFAMIRSDGGSVLDETLDLERRLDALEARMEHIKHRLRQAEPSAR